MEPGRIFITVIVPLGLFMIMMGLGLTLSLRDLKRVFTMPRAVILGLTGQILLLPLLAFLLVWLFAPPAMIAIGLILLAACPGGITSNAYVFASRGDIALSVTLTTLSSMLTVVTMPLLTYLALSLYANNGMLVELPLLNVMRSLALLTVVPIIAGMTLRSFRPGFAQRMVEPVRVMAIGILIMVIVGNTIASFDALKANILQTGMIALTLNLLAMFMGYGLARMFRLPGEQVITMTYEIGVQNIAMVFTLAITILAMPDYSITAMVYGLFMKLSALSFMAYSNRLRRSEESTAPGRVAS